MISVMVDNRKVRSMPIRTPVAVAVAFCCSLAFAQPANNTTSADKPDAKTLFETGGQPAIGPRPYASFLERLASPVEKIELKVAADNIPADGVASTKVSLRLLDRSGAKLKLAQDVTIEADGGARILLPNSSTTESGVGAIDLDRRQPGTQIKVTSGELAFELIAPFKPELVRLRVTVNGVVETVMVRFVPDLREMIAVGLIEGRVRSDKFDPRQILPLRENDGFDNELTGFTKDFNGGKTRAGARGALYLKGKVRGDYLLTVNYDSDKDTRTGLFNSVDPNAFYPVYGDSSVRGTDAQSAHKLYVRIDKNLHYLLLGDYTTADANPARALSQYSRSLPGVRGHFEEGPVTANVFVAQEAYRQVVDEFPGRGVSGPYSVSNPNGITNSEKIEILIRSRFQTQQIIKVTPLARATDYEFEPFSGQIVFRSPVPSIDDQLNPVSIRVTYEVEQGGQKFSVYGGDLKLKVSDRITVGVAAAKDNNPVTPFDVSGVNVALKLSKNTELIAEVARTNSVVNTNLNGFNVNNSASFAGKSGEVNGQAARIEIRHASDELRARVAVAKSDADFNNPAGGMAGGKASASASIGWNVTQKVTVNGELQRDDDDISGASSLSGALGADLKLTDRITIGAGARKVRQNSLALLQTTVTSCGSPGGAGVPTASPGNVAGYNTGFGISQAGNQQIDPATGQLVVCNTAVNAIPGGAPSSIERSQGFVHVGWRPIDSVTLDAELSRVVGDEASELYKLTGRWQATPKLGVTGDFQRSFSSASDGSYRLGADWAVADRTRVFARYEHSQQYAGIYGLGAGPVSSGFSLGVDSQYLPGASVYTEYRIRDSISGRDAQSAFAIGLRNGWNVDIAEGLKVVTNAERLNSSGGNATALGLGLEYSGDPLWKGSTRVEWRRDASTTNWLYTANLARKLDRNWTLIGREYLSLSDPLAAGVSNALQNRLQVAFAYRPVDNNKFDAFGLYENKAERNESGGIERNVNIVSVRGNYHPSRVWWASGRYALKRVSELLEGTIRDSYTAHLLGGRVSYDVTNRISVGALASVLRGSDGGRQYAYGLELGYVLMDNVWVTAGYNLRGFADKDFASNEYSNRGWVLGVRYKFDEDLFRGGDPNVNKTIEPKSPANVGQIK